MTKRTRVNRFMFIISMFAPVLLLFPNVVLPPRDLCESMIPGKYYINGGVGSLSTFVTFVIDDDSGAIERISNYFKWLMTCYITLYRQLNFQRQSFFEESGELPVPKYCHPLPWSYHYYKYQVPPYSS